MRPDRDHERENSWGGFQYRWNYDDYQKSLQRRRKKSAARGMRAFCLTTIFVFLLCFSALVVVMAASLIRGALDSVPSGKHPDGSYSLPAESSDTADPPPPTAETSDSMADTVTQPVEDALGGAIAGDAVGTTLPFQTPAENPGNTASADGVSQQDPLPEFTAETTSSLLSEMTVSEIAATCSASTVTIQCKNDEFQSIGSGFFLSDDGYLVTNYHVIRRYDSYQVLLCDGTAYPAALIESLPEQDLALLKIDTENTAAVRIGDADAAAVGDEVVAIGTPGSVNFAGTVTYGYISGIDRRVEITNADEDIIGHMNMMQITAVINPGNSGGPLFNSRGEVIGINTMKLTGDGYEGMGFSIPINDVLELLTGWIDAHRAENTPVSPETEAPPQEEFLPSTEDALSGLDTAPPLTGGDTEASVPDERPYAAFGVRCETVTAEEAALYRMPIGVIIRYVEPGSYAEQNGLMSGDIILSIDGNPITDIEILDTWAQTVRVGDIVTAVIFRAGTEQTVTISFTDPTAASALPDAEAEATIPDAA